VHRGLDARFHSLMNQLPELYGGCSATPLVYLDANVP
jgi:hypothetical protein